MLYHVMEVYTTIYKTAETYHKYLETRARSAMKSWYIMPPLHGIGHDTPRKQTDPKPGVNKHAWSSARQKSIHITAKLYACGPVFAAITWFKA